MTWSLVIILSLGAFALKVLGFVVVGDRKFPTRVEAVFALVPVAVLCALIVKDTFSVGQELHFDARAIGVGVAIVGVRFKVPVWLVIVLACVATGIARAIS